MFQRRMRALLIGAVWAPATVALAQEAPRVQMKLPLPEGAPTVAPVAVEATNPADLKRQTYGFVEGLAGAAPKINQVARWTEPVCVTVQGLPNDQGAQIKARVEEVAKALNVKVDRRGCNPNVELMFADQPQPFLDRVADTREDLLGYWHQRDRATLKAMTRPVQSWYVTATISGSSSGTGMAFAYVDRTDGSTDSRNTSTNGEIVDSPESRTPPGCGESRFTSCLKSVFKHVLVVVDKRAVQGVDSGLLGDYVSMLAMAQPKSLDGCGALKSVLDVYSRGCAGRETPNGLTRADVAYLTALYKTNLEARKASQDADIGDRMATMLLTANAVDRSALQAGRTKVSTPR